MLVEVELGQGVIASPMSKYASYNTRICRPVGLTPKDRAAVIRFAVEHIGHAYDLKNIVDLMRYFLPQPPVPTRWRRRMLALGSGEPTRAICSTLSRKHSNRCAIQFCRGWSASMTKAAAKSCTSAIIRCSRRAISTFRRSSPSSSQPSKAASTTSASLGRIRRSRRRPARAVSAGANRAKVLNVSATGVTPAVSFGNAVKKVQRAAARTGWRGGTITIA